MKESFVIAIFAILFLGGIYSVLALKSKLNITTKKETGIESLSSKNSSIRKVLKNQTLQYQDTILGTWISQEDTLWKWVYTSNGTCLDYYEGSQQDTFQYNIDSTSPQCGQTVPTGPLFLYLKLQNNTDTICYEIAGLNNLVLNVREISSGHFFFFNRQN